LEKIKQTHIIHKKKYFSILLSQSLKETMVALKIIYYTITFSSILNIIYKLISEKMKIISNGFISYIIKVSDGAKVGIKIEYSIF
jgi:hypothetical protein